VTEEISHGSPVPREGRRLGEGGEPVLLAVAGVMTAEGTRAHMEGPKTVLLVCHANTCRSVMAHVLLEKMLAAREVERRVRVRSGGIGNYARDGMIPSLDARLVLREDGIHLAEDAMTSTDLRQHREIIAGADLILTMTTQQRETLAAFEEARDRQVFTLREFGGEIGDIADPVMKGEEAFRACRDEIKRCLERSIDRLISVLLG
jgi:protein-tyrosine-phosphatase